MATASTETVRLRDGRALEFGQYGDPNGLPVIYFHGFMGSLHQAARADSAAREHGLRLIAPNRPGVGRSTAFRYRQITDIVGDIDQLTRALRVREYALVGISGGCPFALACAHRLSGAARLAAVVSGLGPLAGGFLRQMTRLVQLVLTLSRHCPPLARWMLQKRIRDYRECPAAFADGIIGAWCSADVDIVSDPKLQEVYLADLEAVLTHGAGAQALVWEMQLYFRWGFRLEDLPAATPVLFWHGNDDNFVPPSMTRHMASRVAHSEAIFLPGGHFLAARIVGDVMARVGHALRSPGSLPRGAAVEPLGGQEMKGPALAPALGIG